MKAKNIVSASLFWMTMLLFPLWTTGNAPQGRAGSQEVTDHQREGIKPGIVRVKFSQSAEKSFDYLLTAKSADGFLISGLSELDSLARKYAFVEARQLINPIYAISPASSQYYDRHREWGFHLWFDLVTASKADLSEIIMDIKELSYIEVAGPLLMTELVEAEVEINPDASVITKTDGGNDDTWEPNDPLFSQYQWHLHNTGQIINNIASEPGVDIDMLQAWHIEKGSPQVIVAVMDQGNDYNHPDLASNTWSGIGYNFVAMTDQVSPGSHGAHVSGIIAAVSNNGIGVAGIAGGDGSGNGVRVMSCQIFDENVKTEEFNYYLAYIYAADNGAAISNNSWSYINLNEYDPLDLDAIRYFNAHGGGDVLEGGLTIFSAGNDNTQEYKYPSAFEEVIAVAGTNRIEGTYHITNFGDWVDIAAPGSNIYSTILDASYGFKSGTSMSAPCVTGVAALILSRLPGQFTAQQLRDILLDNTDELNTALPHFAGLLGSGRLNAHKSMQYAMHLAGIPEYAGPFIPRPRKLSAELVGNTGVLLKWEKNGMGQDVMLAYTSQNTQTTLKNGVTYTQGDELPDGWQLLYTGDQTSLFHTGLPRQSVLRYALWTLAGDATYSEPIAVEVHIPDYVTLPIFESFEGGIVPPAYWRIHDADGDGHNWSVVNQSDYTPAADGEYMAFSASFTNDGLLPLTPDNWLVTPQFACQSDMLNISYAVKAVDPDWSAEHYSILKCSSGCDDFAGNYDLLFEETLTDGAWKFHEFDFNGNAGELMNLAFRHHNVTDQFEIVIDNIRIESIPPLTAFFVVATSGENGKISPEGKNLHKQTDDNMYSFFPNTGYHVADVLINGVSAGKSSSHSFKGLESDQSIHVEFAINTYAISTSLSGNGMIEPGGTITATYGQDQSFSILPMEGHHITDVIVDGISLGPAESFVFENIAANHTIHAVFAINTYAISTSLSGNGIIEPGGTITATYGQHQSFNILPLEGHHIADVIVDGTSLGPAESFVFENIAANHTIHAVFAINTYVIEATHGPGGLIEPNGQITINHGDSKSFIIKPSENFLISDVLLNDISLGAIDQFTFTSVTENQIIHASFIADATSISITELESIIKIYPNPANNILCIESNEAIKEVRLVGLEGKIYYHALPKNTMVNIDITNCSPGLYFIQLISAGKQYSRKVAIWR